jgi:PAS domain S-box-containing protein
LITSSRIENAIGKREVHMRDVQRLIVHLYHRVAQQAAIYRLLIHVGKLLTYPINSSLVFLGAIGTLLSHSKWFLGSSSSRQEGGDGGATFFFFRQSPIPSLLLRVPEDGRPITILHCNAAACRQTGFSQEELVGQPLSLIDADPPPHEALMEMLAHMRQGESLTVGGVLRRSGGDTFPVQVFLSLVRLGGAEVVLSQFVDQTAPKQVEEQLRFQANLLEAVNESIITTDLTGHITYSNRGTTELYGWTPEEVLGRSIFNVLNIELPDVGPPALLDFLSKTPVWSGEYIVHHRNGEPLHVWVSGRPLYDTNHTPIGLIGVARDISERIRLVAQLEQRERDIRALIEHIPDVIARFDRNYRHRYINPVIKQVSGVPAEAYLGRTLADMQVDDAFVQRWHSAIDTVFRTGEPVTVETEAQMSTGPRFYEARLIPEFGSDGSVVSVRAAATERCLRAASAGAYR